MTKAEVAAEVARRVTDAAVLELSERMGRSMMLARVDLEAEAYSEVTGEPLDYGKDWRNG
jgi:hypothetical protein